MNKKIVILGAVISLFLGGCSSHIVSNNDNATASPLEQKVTPEILTGKTFFITSMNGQELGKDLKATMNFEKDNRIFGDGFCNLYTGTYDLNFNGLFESKVMSTRRMCEQEKLAADVTLQSILSEQMTFVKTGIGYDIKSDKGTIGLMEVDLVEKKK